MEGELATLVACGAVIDFMFGLVLLSFDERMPLAWLAQHAS